MNQLKEKLKFLLSDPTISEDHFFRRVKKIVDEREETLFPIEESCSLNDLFSNRLSNILDEKTEDNFIPSGFNSIDKEIKGITKGELLVIGGRPAMGKTQLLISLLLNISKNHSCLFFSFDLSKEILLDRILYSITELDTQSINQLNKTEDGMSKLSSLNKEIQDYKIHINESGTNSILNIEKECERQIKENNVEVIFFDYLQLMGIKNHRHSRENEVSSIIRSLKNIARKNNVAIIISSQLSRAVEQRGGDKRPQLSDLRESGTIEQDADKVIFIYRPEYYGFFQDEDGNSTVNSIELILAKNRNGVLNTFNLFKNENFSQIKEEEELSDLEFDMLQKIDVFNQTFGKDSFEDNHLGDGDMPF